MSDNSHCSLLVVDDETYILTTLQQLLSREFEVLTAPSAEAALEVFRQRRVDLVLTDQKMPGMSGVQLLEWARESHPHTMRLLMTGLGDVGDPGEPINRGK